MISRQAWYDQRDDMMSGIDGGELAGQAQANPQLKGIPLIFLTCTVLKIEAQSSEYYVGVRTYVPNNGMRKTNQSSNAEWN